MKNLFLLTGLLYVSFAYSQTKPLTEFEVQQKIYRQSLQYYDLNTAAAAMTHMMVLKPERKELKDSLLFVYFTAERYPQTVMLGEDILKESPAKKEVIEVVALSKQQLGMNKEALTNYEKLLELTGDVYYLYQVAGIQYQLKRIGECLASVDVINGSKGVKERKVSITNSDGNSQEVSLLAAGLNIKALCLLETGKTDQALATLIEVLKIEPEFKLAQNNLQAINKRMAQDSGGQTK